MTQGKYTFLLEDETGFGISMTVPEGETLEQMREHFENFLYACGLKSYEKPDLGLFDDAGHNFIKFSTDGSDVGAFRV